MAHGHIDDDLENAAEKDLPNKVSFELLGGIVIFAILIFATIGGLIVYFHHVIDEEQQEKVGLVRSQELVTLRAHDADVLAGKLPLIAGQKSISIDEAMDKYINWYQGKYGNK